MFPRLLPALCAVTVVAAACGPPDITVRSEEPAAPVFFSQVVDVEGLAGSGVSLTADAEGNPHMAYLAFPEEPAPGEQAAAPDPLAPVLPAVMHAHLVGDIWTRSSVAEDQQDLADTDVTAIAVDPDGIHHVVWSAGGQLLYANNAEGEFSEPEAVAGGEISGPSIAAGEGGVLAVAFYDLLTDAEGPVALVRVATPGKKGWEVETAAEADPGDPSTTGVGFAGQEPMVAYGSGSETLVARDTGQQWQSETADTDGGLGVSMAVDTGGIPHLAYFSGDGVVRHAHPAGEGWEITDAGEGAAGSAASIAVDVEGIHHIAWQTAEGLGYATNPEGEFAGEELPPSTAGGVQPKVAAGAEGVVYLAWYDQEGSELQMATRSDEAPLLAVPSPSPAPGGGAAAPAECQPDGTQLQIAAPPGAFTDGFDSDCLAAPVGEAFTIDFDNQDTGQTHNVAIYTDDTAAQAIFTGETITAPDNITYDVDPIQEEGSLFFRCDIHPTTMTGTFVVAPA